MKKYFLTALLLPVVSWGCETFDDCEPLARAGEAEAQNMLGLMYITGLGVPQDFTEAARWSRKAAEQGLAQAQSNLGAMYAEGQGVPQDDAEAVKWTRKAAEQGLADAQYNLGQHYHHGKGLRQDSAEAIKWWRRAAEQGAELCLLYTSPSPRDLSTSRMPSSA